MKNRRYRLLAACLALLTLALFVGWRASQPQPVSPLEEASKQVQRGMSEKEVEAILAKPVRVVDLSEVRPARGDTWWWYEGPQADERVIVVFQNRVVLEVGYRKYPRIGLWDRLKSSIAAGVNWMRGLVRSV